LYVLRTGMRAADVALAAAVVSCVATCRDDVTVLLLDRGLIGRLAKRVSMWLT
jgi:hypothetical protein